MNKKFQEAMQLVLGEDTCTDKYQLISALKEIECCCKRDYLPALDLMGDLYFFGIHVEQSFLKAYEYHKRSAKLGSLYAKNKLAEFTKKEDNEN